MDGAGRPTACMYNLPTNVATEGRRKEERFPHGKPTRRYRSDRYGPDELGCLCDIKATTIGSNGVIQSDRQKWPQLEWGVGRTGLPGLSRQRRGQGVEAGPEERVVSSIGEKAPRNEEFKVIVD